MTPERLIPYEESQHPPITTLGSEFLDREVGDLMTPGCVTLSEAASVAQAAKALTAHRVHGVLVVGAVKGTPIGWVTARGLLSWLDRDRSMINASEAITEQPISVHPGDPVRAAVQALSAPGATHLLVRRNPNLLPEGVITDLDLAALASL